MKMHPFEGSCCILSAVFLTAFLCVPGPAAHAFTYMDLGNMNLMSYSDAWNLNPTNIAGNTIDGGSATSWGSLPQAFGNNGAAGSDPGWNCLFTGTPTPYYIQWHTPRPVSLSGVNLFSSAATNRSMAVSEFRLYWSATGAAGTWNELVNFGTNVGDPDYGAYTRTGNDIWMAANFTFDPVTAAYFRAEFMPAVSTSARVCELDAIGSVVPVPAAGWLFASGLAGLAVVRRRMRK